MTKFGKIFCNLVANFKGVQLQGVQLSPLGFAACQSKKCTNNANRANYRRVWHPAIPTLPPNYLPTEATETTEISDARYSPTDCTDVHRLGGYGILPYPRSHQTIFPQNSRDTQKRLAEKKNLCTSVKSVGGSYLKGHTCYVGAAETAAPPKDLCENLCNLWENILRLKLL